MKAAHVAEYYTAYLEGSLPEELRQEVARHLEACPQCAAELEEMRLLIADLRALPEVPAPPDFVAGVRARLEARPAPRPWFLRMPALAGGTLVAAALVLAIVVAPNLQAPRRTLVARQPQDAGYHALKDLSSADAELKVEKPETVAPPTAAKPMPAPSARETARVENTPEALTTPGADRRGGGSVKLGGKAKDASPPRSGIADMPPVTAALTPAQPAKPGVSVGEPAPTLVAQLPPTAVEIYAADAEAPAAALPTTKALGPAGPQGPAGPLGATGNTDGAGLSRGTAPAVPPPLPTLGMTTADVQGRAAGDVPVTNGTITADLNVNGARFRAALPGALVLRSAVVKETEAAITVETAAKTPVSLTLRPIEPTPGKARSLPLSAEVPSATFTLPLKRGGSVAELTVQAEDATTRAYLAAPDTSARQPSVTLNLKKAPMTVVLQQLAVAGRIFILSPPEFAEMTNITYATNRTQPDTALSELASRHGYQVVLTGNLAVLTPKPPAP